MTFGGLVVMLVIAAVCAVIVQSLSEWSLGGAVTAAVFGFIGALGGAWASSHWRLPHFLPFRIGEESFPVIWAILGAFFVASVVGMLNRVRLRG
jgi:uncharacterized membrane protein YeaQ/YmgE (transglycosylase-associated protein family)